MSRPVVNFPGPYIYAELVSTYYYFVFSCHNVDMDELANMFDFVSTLLAGLWFLGANANLIYLLLEVWDSYL